MKSLHDRRRRWRWRQSLPLAAALSILAGGADAATTNVLAAGLSAPIGVHYEPLAHDLYFVEYVSGDLERLDLDTTCEVAVPPTCAVSTVATGFTHPEDVAVTADGLTAYVTTRDDPGTSGKLWRVDLASGTKSLVTFNLEAPHQIVLGPDPGSAYVVGFTTGRLWKVDLTTGAKVPLVDNLPNPVGLAMDEARTRAWVTVQGGGGRLLEVDLTGGLVNAATSGAVREVVVGLTAPFYLAWSDAARTNLYLVERDPADRVRRVDVLTGSAIEAVAGLPVRPSGVAAEPGGAVIYVTTGDRLVRVALVDLPMTKPVFLGVGNVPSTSIDADGYATTGSGYFFAVTDAPFGGGLNILGNLNNFKSLGATHYRVLMSDDGGVTFKALTPTWSAYRFDPASGKYQLTSVAPEPGDDRYAIPVEYPTAPQRWLPAFLMLRWPSSTNGLRIFKVELFERTGATWQAVALSPAGNELRLQIDNTPPEALVKQVLQEGVGAVGPCGIVETGANLFRFEISAYDPSHHLAAWSLSAKWGMNKQEVIASDSYAAHDDEEATHWWSGATSLTVPKVPAAAWDAKCDCAHTFEVHVVKRTIDGYTHILRRHGHQSVTIRNTGTSCS